MSPLSLLRLGIGSLLLLPAMMRAEDPAPAAPKPPPVTESNYGQNVFSLAPKSFQKNPLVDQTVVTEMTDSGRKIPLPSAENPAYYAAQPGGYHTEGHGTEAEQPPPESVMTGCLKQALATNHYLPADPGHPPTLLIVYVWGVHNNLDKGSDEIGGASPDIGHKNLLSRAALVGGTKFAAELKDVLQQHDLQAEVTSLGTIMDPLYLFVARDPKIRQLYEQSLANCYYVVASAYDYQSAARKEGRKLLWRSKMTVDAAGVSMTDTLPTLVLNAGQYLGRDMPESATFTKRISRNTQVKYGPMEVKEYLEKPAEPKPETKP
jgi:hypothetical protein